MARWRDCETARRRDRSHGNPETRRHGDAKTRAGVGHHDGEAVTVPAPSCIATDTRHIDTQYNGPRACCPCMVLDFCGE
jgi:hypothetical protein